MPHLVIDRTRGASGRFAPLNAVFEVDADTPMSTARRHKIPTPRTRRVEVPTLAVVVEAGDVVAGVLLIVGSVFFMPRFMDDFPSFMTGCICFAIANTLYVIVCTFSMVEAIIEGSRVAKHEIGENALYMFGAVIYIIGCFLYMPLADGEDELRQKGKLIIGEPLEGIDHLKTKLMDHSQVCLGCASNIVDKGFMGTMLFIAGSLIWAFAAYVNALSQGKVYAGPGAYNFLYTCTTLFWFCGCVSYVMASVAYIPNLGCGTLMTSAGSITFIVGSAFFTFGSLASLVRTAMVILEDPAQEREAPPAGAKAPAVIDVRGLDL